ncbi:MAG: hypothetical protein ABIL68_03290 [bacterium]
MKTVLPQKIQEPFSSNAIRLSIREWLIALMITVGGMAVLHEIWQRIEAFTPDTDYRIPYNISEDYWLFHRYCRSVCVQDKILLIGDSVIWGQYVHKNQTLTHYLNKRAGEECFRNLGLDGCHPMALAGLIEHYGRDIKGKDVILHLNLLWLSSPRTDLQTDKEFRFNHPRLVPQFVPHIPCYTESISRRIGIIVKRNILLLNWPNHVQSVYFSNTSLSHWTMENPYANPFSRITFCLPESDKNEHTSVQSWNSRSQNLQHFPWVKLETSLQWRAFQRLVALLQTRHNRVFIIVGPLNETVLEPESLKIYKQLLINIQTWMEEAHLPHYVFPPLPGHLYADASHPLNQGYERMAEQIWKSLRIEKK